MANEEHIALLGQGVATWNELRENNPALVPDLFEANLEEADLRGETFAGRTSARRTSAGPTSLGRYSAARTS
jgi:hypothetical protein